MPPIPPAATDPATAACEIDVLFVPRGSEGRQPSDPPLDDEELITFVTAGVADRDTIRTRAYAQMRQRLGVDADEDVNAEYEMTWTQLRFHDPPWANFAELQEQLAALAGVRNERYVTPTSERYRPPHHLLEVESGAEERVADAVSQYYPGLETAIEAGRVYVLSLPVRNPERHHDSF